MRFLGRRPNPAKTQDPMLFDPLKWKSDKFNALIGLKWREIISYASHFLDWSKIIGRGLNLMIRELCMQNLGLGFRRMQGGGTNLGPTKTHLTYGTPRRY